MFWGISEGQIALVLWCVSILYWLYSWVSKKYNEINASLSQISYAIQLHSQNSSKPITIENKTPASVWTLLAGLIPASLQILASNNSSNLKPIIDLLNKYLGKNTIDQNTNILPSKFSDLNRLRRLNKSRRLHRMPINRKYDYTYPYHYDCEKPNDWFNVNIPEIPRPINPIPTMNPIQLGTRKFKTCGSKLAHHKNRTINELDPILTDSDDESLISMKELPPEYLNDDINITSVAI